MLSIVLLKGVRAIQMQNLQREIQQKTVEKMKFTYQKFFKENTLNKGDLAMFLTGTSATGALLGLAKGGSASLLSGAGLGLGIGIVSFGIITALAMRQWGKNSEEKVAQEISQLEAEAGSLSAPDVDTLGDGSECALNNGVTDFSRSE